MFNLRKGCYMKRAKVLAKGQIVIPASIRKKYGIQPGNEIQIFEYGNIIYLVPPARDPVEQAIGCLPSTPSLSEELLRERREDFSE
jgi:AbrB family looped-hinge helix DNA binding protein